MSSCPAWMLSKRGRRAVLLTFVSACAPVQDFCQAVNSLETRAECATCGGGEGELLRCRACSTCYHPACLDLPEPPQVCCVCSLSGTPVCT